MKRQWRVILIQHCIKSLKNIFSFTMTHIEGCGVGLIPHSCEQTSTMKLHTRADMLRDCLPERFACNILLPKVNQGLLLCSKTKKKYNNTRYNNTRFIFKFIASHRQISPHKWFLHSSQITCSKLKNKSGLT